LLDSGPTVALHSLALKPVNVNYKQTERNIVCEKLVSRNSGLSAARSFIPRQQKRQVHQPCEGHYFASRVLSPGSLFHPTPTRSLVKRIHSHIASRGSGASQFILPAQCPVHPCQAWPISTPILLEMTEKLCTVQGGGRVASLLKLDTKLLFFL
jgi:hypothetical protein